MNKLLISIAIASALVACDNEAQFDATGAFEATEIIVSAEATGKILRFDIAEGDRLAAGQTVGAIDSVQLYLSKLQLLKSASALLRNSPDVAKQIAATQAELAKQQRERERVERLVSDNAAPQKQLDDIVAAIDILQKRLDAQRNTLEKSASSINAQSQSVEIQVASIADRLSKCRITAPIGGTVLTKYAEAGEFTAPGKPLFKIADLDRMFLRAYFTNAQLADIKLNQSVAVIADFGEGHSFSMDGVITWISSESEFTPKSIQTADSRANLVYAVKIAVKNDGRLKIGGYGEVKIK